MRHGKNICGTITALVVLFAIAGNVEASLRPLGDATQLSELQGVFNSIGATSIDAVNDQISEMVFEPTSPNSSAEYVTTVSYAASDIDFGIYNLADPSQKITLFNHPVDAEGNTTLLQFNLAANYVRTVDGESLTLIDSTTYFMQFGFYAVSVYGTFYSEDDLNSDGAHFLSYQAEGDEVTIGNHPAYNDTGHYYIATEVTPINENSDDFTDMVVQMESIIPIPEPASLVLVCITSSAIVFIRRRLVD